MLETSPGGYDSVEEDSLEGECGGRGERWAPLGAVASPEPGAGEDGEMARLTEEQEQLNGALMALTSHFAQVQFRLRQIVDSECPDREQMLRDLEEFAFRGIPDAMGEPAKFAKEKIIMEMNQMKQEAKLEEQKKKQLDLIEQLKKQLEDLECYAYETGEMDQPPTSKLMEKQKLVIDQIGAKLDIDLENLHKLTPEQLREVVDSAVGQIINPGKVKEKLVDQLKTQIVDLERFIHFLQGEGELPPGMDQLLQRVKCQCQCPVHGQSAVGSGDAECTCKVDASSADHKSHKSFTSASNRDKEARERTIGIMKRAVAILHLFAVSQLGCGSEDFASGRANLMKRSKGTVAQHWGDVRARLEVAVERTVEVAGRMERARVVSGGEEEDAGDVGDEEYHSDTEEYMVNEAHKELTQTVRKELCPALRDLLQHGLMEVGPRSSSLLPLGCLPTRSKAASNTTPIHVWQLFLKFYQLKNGRAYNESPARKLSQSFDLDIVGGKALTTKQHMLSAIGNVLQSHTSYKRSHDSQFKALISIALNEKKLVPWLKQIVKNPIFVDYYYMTWSYTAKTGFDDALHSLNRLNNIEFKLPFDLAVRQFTNIKDAF